MSAPFCSDNRAFHDVQPPDVLFPGAAILVAKSILQAAGLRPA
jgi:hypothetical protein